MATKQSTELTLQESRELIANPAYQTMKTFELQQRMAQMYVTSTIVPTTYRGNIGNCVIAIDMAMRMQANPLMVMQNLYIVHGNPAWSSKFLISCINTSGRFTPLRYQFAGTRGTDKYGCRAYAYEKSDKDHKEPLYGTWITIEMAKKEGWTDKGDKGVSKWLTMPDQMLIYRSAAFWARAYAPEISMGFLTKEEAEDIVDVDFEEIPSAAIEHAPEAVKAEAAPVAEAAAPSPAPASAPAPAEERKAPKPANPKDIIREAINAQSKPLRSENVDTATGELFDEKEL